MSAHVFKVGARATVVGSDYDVAARASREVVLAIGTVEHAKARVRLDTGAEYHARGGAWRGYGGADGRLRPYQPGDEERLAERRAERVLDDAKRARSNVDGYVDRAQQRVDDACAYLKAMQLERDQLQAELVAAEARLAEARAAAIAASMRGAS